METQTGLQKTVSLEWVRRLSGGLISDRGILGIIKMYRECPVDVVREACFQALKELATCGPRDRDDDEMLALRTLIADLVHCGARRDETVRFIDLLLFDMKRYMGYSDESREFHREKDAEDIEFVLGLRGIERSRVPESDLVKATINRVLDKVELYPLVPTLPQILAKEIAEIMPRHFDAQDKKREYMDTYWNHAYRAMKLVAAVRDTSFLPQLEEILKLYDDRLLGQWGDEREPIPVTAAHRSIVATVVNRLRLVRQKEAQHELSHVLT